MNQAIRQSKPSFRKRFLRIALPVVAFYLLLCLGCASFQRRMIYFPPACTPEKMEELARTENLERWRNADGRLLGWKRLLSTQVAQGQVLLMHGNACCAFECGH